MRKVFSIVLLCGTLPLCAHAIVITEIMYHPPAQDEATYEWVELYNDYAVPFDIGGWSFSSGIRYTFPAKTVMPGYSHVVVCADPAAMQAMYGIPAGKLFGPFEGRLDNNGEEIAVADKMGAIMAHMRYRDRHPWPAGADGTGFSLALINPDRANDDNENWALSLKRLGNPGEPNGFDTAAILPASLGSGAGETGEHVAQASRLPPSTIGASDRAPPTGLTGEETGASAPLTGGVVINEFLANSDPDTFVELLNNSDQYLDIGLAYLSDDPENLTKYRIPQGKRIPPWGQTAFTGTEMGFQLPDSNGAIYVTTSDGATILDAQAYDVERKGYSRARYPDGGMRWYSSPTPTPGNPNEISVNTSIVINEIMYHPYENRNDLEYIELYNHAQGVVDLSGWSFADGVDFVFPLGTALGSDEYLVVCRNKNEIDKKYRISNTIGDYLGSLDNEGEHIELVDVLGNVVDEVRYAGGGQWPGWAAGWGSSLELIDPKQDNSSPSAWEDSDDRAAARWSYVEYTAEFDGGESEFHFFLMHRGECLIDDISVKRGELECIPNGSFESGTDYWLIEGNHIQSSVYTGEAHSGSRCLKIVATGRGDTGANRIECDTANRLSAGSPYTISFWAKWQRGMNLIYTRSHNQGFPKASRIPMSARRGTPGARNSVYSSNLGPVISDVTQDPVAPSPSSPVKVTARISDSDGVASVRVYYKGDWDANFSNVQMYDLGVYGDGRPGDGVYAGTIPARGSTDLMRFYIEATDSRAATARYPAKPETYCLYQIESSTPQTQLPVYRILLTHEVDEEFRYRTHLSNELLDCTFVFNDSEIFYNCGIRTRGSGWTRGSHPSSHYRIQFPADQPVRGRYREINLDWREDDTRQRDSTVHHLLRQMGGVPTSYHRYAHVRFNDSFYAIAEEPLIVDGEYVRLYWPDDGAGPLFKVDDHFEWTDWWQHTHWDAYLDWQGEDGPWDEEDEKEKYRWNWELHTNEKEDNYTDFLEFVHFMDVEQTSNSEFVYGAQNVLDVDEWLKVLAVRFLVDDWDTLGYDRGKNAYIYKPYHTGDGTPQDPPRHGKWALLAWDSDLTFSDASAPIVSAKFPSIKRMLDMPKFQRRYYGYFLKLIDGPFTRAEIDPVLDGVYQVLGSEPGAPNGPGSLKNFVSSRSSYIRSRIPKADLAITTNSGNPLEVQERIIILEGTAPIAAHTMVFSTNGGPGQPFDPTWTDATHWQATILLNNYKSTFEISARNTDGAEVGKVSITVTLLLSPTEDTDGDGLYDREEAKVYNTHFLKPDTDGDGLTDGDEVHFHKTDPTKADTDGDALPDGWEIQNSLDPTVNDAAEDPDDDDLSNAEEFQHGTNPRNPDTDGDGFPDAPEVLAGTNPLDKTSWFDILDIRRASDAVSLSWTTVPGREYAVHASEDFTTWKHVHTLIADGNTASFTDSEVVPAGSRFYKVEVLPLP